MKAEADRDVAAAGRSPDVAARLRKRKAKIDTAAERIANMTVTVGPACRNLQPFSSLWKYEQGQGPRVPQGSGAAKRLWGFGPEPAFRAICVVRPGNGRRSRNDVDRFADFAVRPNRIRANLVAAIGRAEEKAAGVRTEKLDSDVLVMKPADQGMRHDAANPLNRARDRRIFVQ
jgi:hypothetical protein